MKKCLFFLFFLPFLSLHAKSLNRPPLKILLLADTSDPKMRAYHLSDVKRMKKACTLIAKRSNYGISITVLKGKKVTTQNIEKWLHTRPYSQWGNNLIYYSGAALEPLDPSSLWPCVKMENSKKISTFDIRKKVLESCPRPFSTKLFFDCYNQVKKTPLPSINASSSNENLLRLFFKSHGNCLLCSSKSNSFSIGLKHKKAKGGLFTVMLLKTILENKTEIVTWNHICDDVAKKCTAYGQQPLSQIPYMKYPETYPSRVPMSKL